MEEYWTLTPAGLRQPNCGWSHCPRFYEWMVTLRSEASDGDSNRNLTFQSTCENITSQPRTSIYHVVLIPTNKYMFWNIFLLLGTEKQLRQSYLFQGNFNAKGNFAVQKTLQDIKLPFMSFDMPAYQKAEKNSRA